MWTRKPTVIGGQTAPNDWTVLCNGQRCGRVLQVHAPHAETGTEWSWSTWSNPAASGRSDTLEQALEEVRQAVIRAGGKMAGTYPDIEL